MRLLVLYIVRPYPRRLQAAVRDGAEESVHHHEEHEPPGDGAQHRGEAQEVQELPRQQVGEVDDGAHLLRLVLRLQATEYECPSRK